MPPRRTLASPPRPDAPQRVPGHKGTGRSKSNPYTPDSPPAAAPPSTAAKVSELAPIVGSNSARGCALHALR